MQFSYKIKIICAVWLIVSAHFPVKAQKLQVVKKNKTYWQQVQTDSAQAMVELKSLDTGFVYDLRYATANNFTGRQLYKQGTETYLRRDAAGALLKVQDELNKKGCGLKIFDAYRPYSITKKMWELVRDERYAANPAKGSGHNRGLAVDVTIIDLKAGKELDMGTGYDNFTDTAHHDFKNLPVDVLANRLLLKASMEKAGFRAFATEWWHYNWPNDRNYQVLDINFKK